MRQPLLSSFLTLVTALSGSFGRSIPRDPEASLQPREECENTPTSRHCWGKYSIDTDYYDNYPTNNGPAKEFWLSVEEGPCSPDGYERTCKTFNGTVPGPTLFVDWGDEVIVHVTNNMVSNATSVHFHGVRMLNNSINDGVPGVTQCPIPPGHTMTYRFQVTQYGSTWYHSHLSLQYADGMFGGFVVRGPTTDNYDEDLGVLFLQDWSHVEAFTNWHVAMAGPPPPIDNWLINATNTYNCTGRNDDKCVGGGKKFEMVFEQDKKYLLRLFNVAMEGVFEFSIDGHSLEVVGNDLVPIVPYMTDSVQLSIGQRYDVIVHANADPGNYWLRAHWVKGCDGNSSANVDPYVHSTGIVRYDAGSTDDPETESHVTPTTSCLGEPPEKTIPYLSIDVANTKGGVVYEEMGSKQPSMPEEYFQWTINTSSLVLNWTLPTMDKIMKNENVFPTEYNVVPIKSSGTGPEWAALLIQDISEEKIPHPIHLHGHDFWVLAAGDGVFDGDKNKFNTNNPARRDVATLPGGGYIAVAFRLDNPGAWLIHCHIGWHASQGLALEFIENQSDITFDELSIREYEETCKAWGEWEPVWPQDDSGI
ncbi:hypothetical protein VTH82DRAFT_6509 [Thermothelomyces myriococcoides]